MDLRKAGDAGGGTRRRRGGSRRGRKGGLTQRPSPGYKRQHDTPMSATLRKLALVFAVAGLAVSLLAAYTHYRMLAVPATSASATSAPR